MKVILIIYRSKAKNNDSKLFALQIIFIFKCKCEGNHKKRRWTRFFLLGVEIDRKLRYFPTIKFYSVILSSKMYLLHGNKQLKLKFSFKTLVDSLSF